MIKPGRDVKDIKISNQSGTDDIFKQLEQSGGFESRNIADGVEIITNMIQDEKCLKFLSFIKGCENMMLPFLTLSLDL